MASNTHDDVCELIEVGIGVGIQVGPCFCHYRKLEREFSVAQERIKMLETGTRSRAVAMEREGGSDDPAKIRD